MTFELPLPPTPTLETERLLLRPLQARDAPAIQRQFPDFEVVKHLNARIPWPYPDDGAATYVAKCLDETARGAKFHWGVTLKGHGDEIIGVMDLWPFDGETRSMRGFWLAREFWGRGLMTEAAERVTAYAFEDLGWPHLFLSNAQPNRGSHRVKEKQGAEVVDVRPDHFMSGEFPRVTWLLTREAWTARRRD
jgi:[ribosomal protein S5]-alanine N-acetyltransferase